MPSQPLWLRAFRYVLRLGSRAYVAAYRLYLRALLAIELFPGNGGPPQGGAAA